MSDYEIDNGLEDDEDEGCGVRALAGIALVFLCIAILFVNEVRFDAAAAAARTTPVGSAAALEQIDVGDNFSISGRVDPGMQLSGKYTRAFGGFLAVKREAEIYAWDRRRRSGGKSSWRLKWMAEVEDNSRNRELGLVPTYTSALLLPENLRVAGVRVDTRELQFVDSFDPVPPGSLPLRKSRLQQTGIDRQFVYKRRNSGAAGGFQPGDERLSWSALRMPAGPVSYFGRYSGHGGEADDSQRNDSELDQLILNHGLLHHVILGDRPAALESLQAYQDRLKKIMRILGTLGLVLGLYYAAGSLMYFLIGIPVIGMFFQASAMVFAAVVGLPLAGVVILSGMVVANLWLVLGAVAVGAGLLWIRRRNAGRSREVRRELKGQFREELVNYSMAEIEFMEMARLAASDGAVAAEERKLLFAMGERQGWSLDDCSKLLDAAQSRRAVEAAPGSSSTQLHNLVRLALADGTISGEEMKLIQAAASRCGVEGAELRRLIVDVRRGVAPSEAPSGTRGAEPAAGRSGGQGAAGLSLVDEDAVDR